jgi:hypothetical protein
MGLHCDRRSVGARGGFFPVRNNAGPDDPQWPKGNG